MERLGDWGISYHFHYLIAGDCTFPPLLLLHGWMGNCRDYTEIIELLKSRYYCIAIDLPGHGKTEVVGDNLGYGFRATAIGIIQLLNSLKIGHCTIAGYSLGGRLALYLTLEFPNRFDRTILESTSPGLLTIIERQHRIASDAQIISQLTTAKFPTFVANWYQQQIFTGLDRHPHYIDLVNCRISTNRLENLAKSLEFAGLGQQMYLGDRLSVHKQPISLIVGTLDLKFVSIAQTIHQNYPWITLHIIPNCSHNVHFQQPQLWANIVANH